MPDDLKRPMKPPATPEEMIAHAEILEADAARQEAAAAIQRREALAWRYSAKRLVDAAKEPPDSSSLTSEELSVRNESMSSVNLTAGPILPLGRTLESDGPFAVVAKKLKVSVTAVAKAVGVSPATAHVWNNRGKIPNEGVRTRLAEIEKKGIPALKQKRGK